MVHFDPENKLAVFRAKITIPEGGSATGWGSETGDDFKDFIEKAETKAIGRACAALGFGTQHCQDFDYDSQSQGRVVDAPVKNPAPTQQAKTPTAQQTLDGQSKALVTEKQVKFIYGTGKAQGMSDGQVVSLCRSKFGVVPEDLSRGDGSRFIDMLKQPI
ncbi:MAG: hypothetical protein HXX20_02085 [Chloroflexi bacterium]|nr:hypothetical protein [Chloroflexota bacterium]